MRRRALAHRRVPDDPQGPELLLEPDSHPAARPFKSAPVAEGIPATSFAVDVQAEYQRLSGLGIFESRQSPLPSACAEPAVASPSGSAEPRPGRG